LRINSFARRGISIAIFHTSLKTSIRVGACFSHLLDQACESEGPIGFRWVLKSRDTLTNKKKCGFSSLFHVSESLRLCPLTLCSYRKGWSASYPALFCRAWYAPVIVYIQCGMCIYRWRGQTEKIVAQAKGFTIQGLTTDLNIYSFWTD